MRADLTADDRVIAAVRRIVRAIDLHSHELVERFGVTGPQLIALKELDRMGQVPVGRLARTVRVSHPTMTGILDRLARRGLVERARDPEDRRRITAQVTEAGRRLLGAAPSPLQDRFRAAFFRLEEWEQTQMLATLQRVAAMMEVEELDAAPVLTTGTALGGGAAESGRPSGGPNAPLPSDDDDDVQHAAGRS